MVSEPVARADKKFKETGNSSKNWYKDRYEAVITQRNFLGVIAVSSLLLALVAGFIILYMLPQKTVMPFLIQVDEKTGSTITVEDTSKKKITADESLRRYFVVKFLKARESYDAADLDVTSNTVRLLADRPVFRQYWDEVVNAQNKDSLLVTLQARGTRQVEIKSVQFFDANRAQIRLTVVEKDKTNVSMEKIRHYIALVTFQFANISLNMEDMTVNPLGFQVMEYRLDEDSSV